VDTRFYKSPWFGPQRPDWGDLLLGLLTYACGDYPSCVNPKHLFVGTYKDNMIDCCSKNRHNSPKGEEHWFSKLTLDQVTEIRNGYVGLWGEITEISKKYNVSISTIRTIISGQAWVDPDYGKPKKLFGKVGAKLKK